MKPTHAPAIKSRITRLDARVRESTCPHTIAFLVRAMSAELDPQAIAPLIGLLDHKHDANDAVGCALLRYGESAEDSVRAAAKDSPSAKEMLISLELHNRLRQLGCF